MTVIVEATTAEKISFAPETAASRGERPKKAASNRSSFQSTVLI